jgi:glycosyltransferase involved in cell wall biosynthesis
VKKVLIISSVWCEPNSSAAGLHLYQIIRFFHQNNWQITFCITAGKTGNEADLSIFNVQEKQIPLNSSTEDDWLKSLNPDLVIFDRFMAEEQFGWKIRDFFPNALTILNTEDLHSLRKTREMLKGNNFTPELWKNQEITKREMASIYRTDASLFVSDFEMDFLNNNTQVNPEKLIYLPLIYQKNEKIKPFEQRKHFYTIGNFAHAPNLDSIKFVKQEIWQRIRRALPEAEFHVYGSYCTDKIKELNDPKNGFLVKGFCDDLETLANYKICLAPLRFGAGIKGKFLEAMQLGTPSATTNIGVEGIVSKSSFWSGVCADTTDEIITKTIELYQSENLWNEAQKKGFEIIENKFSDIHHKHFFKNLDNLQKLKNADFVGEILKSEHFNSKKYFSKWIEAKNKC